MAQSTDYKSPELIARRDRPFTLYYYRNMGENESGRMQYQQIQIKRVHCELRRGNSRTIDGNMSANQNYITLELRDCNVRDFIAPTYQRDFCIVCTDAENAPADNLTPETARHAGFNPWTINQVQPIFNVGGRKVQVQILAN